MNGLVPIFKPIQGWLDEVLDEAERTKTVNAPPHALEWARTDGLDVAIAAWEDGGELGVIPWPPPFFHFSDEEVALEFEISTCDVTDSARIQSLRNALDPEYLDHFLLCAMPIRVAGKSGVTGILCLIVELQGQSGPYVLEGWVGRGDAMYLNQSGYYFLSEITDEMILEAWVLAKQRQGSAAPD